MQLFLVGYAKVPGVSPRKHTFLRQCSVFRKDLDTRRSKVFPWSEHIVEVDVTSSLARWHTSPRIKFYFVHLQILYQLPNNVVPIST